MKLAFNGLNSGLGNNGGSRTIIKCCEVLNSLGHSCDIIANVDNFSWFDHKPVINYLPTNLDAIISIAAVDVPLTLRIAVPVKAWYIRGHESWANPEHLLVDYYKNENILNVVNSNGLKQLLSTWGADSYVIYQGIDFDWWEDRKLRKDGIIRIGCLYGSKLTKRWQDFVKLHSILGDEKYEYVSIGDVKPKSNFIKKSWANINHDELCNVYSSCDIWFAPTELEGLHNVPIEAALCGCLIVCGDEPMNGMIYDYAFPNNTAMVYDRKDIKHAAELIKNPNWELIGRMQKHIKENIGSRETNIKKLVKLLEMTDETI